MNKTTTKLRRIAGGALTTALAAAALMMAATAAQADIELSHTMVSDPDHVGVELHSLPEGAEEATHYTIAECNAAATLGTRCNPTNGTWVGFTPIEELEMFGDEIDVEAAFTDYNFIAQAFPIPATDTECAETEGADDCVVAVSYYEAPNYPAPPFIPVGEDSVEITFE
jgi:hypothetical protein